ncbi:MAG: alanine racemase, partial [Acidobacteria bacterium]|nr:alanine racemase [Acidobacteriota bacterium]
MRPSWIEIDLDAIEHNVRSIAAVVAPAAVCAVVKADGYGHGDIPAAEAALRGGATHLAVALVNEGIRLREAGIDAPILVLSEPPDDLAEVVVKWRLTPTVYRLDFMESIAATVTDASSDPVAVHVKVDTGMHRVGAAAEVAFELVTRIEQDDRLILGGVFTHFAVAEEDAAFTLIQIEQFDGFVDRLHTAGIYPPLVHACNTAGATVHGFTADEAGAFRWDLDAALEAIRAQRPRLVFLCNPNNPTGVYEDQATVCRMALDVHDDSLLVLD